MKMQDLKRYSAEELDRLQYEMILRGNAVASKAIADFREFYGKQVTVVKGRKVPHGTTGECFWMGTYDNSKYGDPWGIYTTTRIGIRDAEGNVYWTALDNVRLA